MVSFTRKWKVVLLVCIIVSVSLLIAFQIGWIGQPGTETVNLETVEWKLAHPTGSLEIGKWSNATFEDASCMLNFGILVGSYFPTAPAALDFEARVDILGRSKDFYVKSASFDVVSVTNQTMAELAKVLTDFKNLSLARTGTDYVDFAGIGNSQSAYFFTVTRWYTTELSNLTCATTVVSEVTYYNGTGYRRIVQPFELILEGDKHALSVKAALVSTLLRSTPVNVTVWVNDTQYVTPILLSFTPGTCILRTEQEISLNSTIYQFQSWAGNELYGSGNPFKFGFVRDIDVTAYFRQK